MQIISINDWRNNVLWCEELTITQKAVGCAICSFYRQDKLCFPSYTTLCEMLNISRATLSSAIKSLVDNKFLKVKKGEISRLSSMTNFYEFVGVNGSNDSLTNSSADSSNDSSANSSPNSSADSSITELEYSEVVNIGKKRNNICLNSKPSSNKKITTFEIIDWETLFAYWEQNKKGGKYKNIESRNRQLGRLKDLSGNNFELAKKAIFFAVDNGYQGFTDGSKLFYREKVGEKPQIETTWQRNIRIMQEMELENQQMGSMGNDDETIF